MQNHFYVHDNINTKNDDNINTKNERCKINGKDCKTNLTSSKVLVDHAIAKG